MSKEFTKGEILTVLTGHCLSEKDKLACALIEYLSGEPVWEFTWMAPSPNRIDVCANYLSTVFPELDAIAKSIQQYWDDPGFEASLSEMIAVPPYPGEFPGPPVTGLDDER